MSIAEKLQFAFAVSKFRVKIKSLAEEARIIRHEVRRRKRCQWVPGCLNLHRTGILRREQRHTLLAYAILRGHAYARVEQRTVAPPDMGAIARIYQSLTGSRKKIDVAGWLEGGPATSKAA